MWINIFTKAELVAYLLATDVYLTPYLNHGTGDQRNAGICHGLWTPVGVHAVFYAQFLLGEDRGLLVRAQDAKSIATACVTILTDPELQQSMERSNWRYGQTMIWPRVGQDYLQLFQHLTERNI